MAARLFALWLIMIALQGLSMAVALAKQYSGGEGAAMFYVMPLLPLLLAAFLWSCPMFVAQKLLPRTDGANTLSVPGRELLAAGVAILGIWTLLRVLPPLFAVLGLAMVNRPMLGYYFTPDRLVDLSSSALEAGLGIFLAARPRLVARKIMPGEAVSTGRE
ncbi:hypothetical protein CXB49_08100 [Chromobacterium sp. ATCC 53434]|nr:hypothetical protein [Chromobacterium sp. ATCC 53434]AUH50766.1 hypothetical protein CXB49_08100 [Chromobacterium sp. ATCC 53434]